LKNFEVQKLLEFLTSSHSAQIKCAVAVHVKIQQNIEILKEEIENLKQLRDNFIQPTEESVQYDQKRLELLEPYTLKLNNTLQIIPGFEEEVKTKLKDFNQNYKDLLTDVYLQKQNWNDFFYSEDSPVKLHLIDLNDLSLPNDMPKESFDALYLMIKKD